MFGNRHDDTLNGGQSNDFLNGGGGDDRLNGGVDNDALKGGAGADRLRIDDALPSGQGVVDAFGSVQDGDVVLDFGGGDMIRLDGVNSLAGPGDQIDIF